MSSQGPAVTGSVAPKGFAADPAAGSPSVGKGYTFTTGSVRDAGDWIAYKKQQLIKRETTAGINQTTWFKSGNDFRIQHLLGRYKCDSCKVSYGSVPSS